MSITVVVEDGSGVDGGNAYLDIADWKTYAFYQGWDFSAVIKGDRPSDPTDGEMSDKIAAAIIRGRGWLDASYRSRWPGFRTNGRDQATAWPRRDVIDGDGEDIADDEIPQEIIDASAQAAWRELQEPGSLSPDLERGGAIKSLKAGSVEVTYADNAPVATTRTLIDEMIAGLLLDLPANTAVSWPKRA